VSSSSAAGPKERATVPSASVPSPSATSPEAPADHLQSQLAPVTERFATESSPFVNPPRQPRLHFVLPLLVVEVAFSEVTRHGILRHPALKGLRADKPANEVTWDGELGAPP